MTEKSDSDLIPSFKPYNGQGIHDKSASKKVLNLKKVERKSPSYRRFPKLSNAFSKALSNAHDICTDMLWKKF